MAAATAMSSQQHLRLRGRLEQIHRQREHGGGGDAAQRDVAGQPDEHDPDRDRHAQGDGVSASMTPAAVATPFPPLNPTKTEKTWPSTAVEPADEREQLEGETSRREDEHRHGPLAASNRPTGIAYFQPRTR